MNDTASGQSAPLSILHTEASLGWGGQEIRILSEAQGCLERGHRVHLLAPIDSGIHPAARRLGVPVEALPIGRKRLANLFALREWLRRHAAEFDVVNTHSSTDSWLTALSLQSLGRPLPLVRTRHVSTAVDNGITTRWLYRRATAHIVTTGEALREQLHRDNGFDLAAMTSVRTGIDLSRYRPQDRAAMRARLGLPVAPTLGILATLRDWKGHHHLLEAFARLRGEFPAWRLLIVGDGPEWGRLQERVARLELGEAVSMPGNREDAEDWLAAMDLFVLPSYGNEGVPQGIMQAMACGLPVVATPVGAVGEAVVDGVTGLMTKPADPARLAETLALLMSDPVRRDAMGAAGLARARSHFGIDVMVTRMVEVFRQAVAAHRSRAVERT